MTISARPPRRHSIEQLWCDHLSIARWPLWAALVPASALYAVLMAVRARWWRTTAHDPGVTTLSVGNLTLIADTDCCHARIVRHCPPPSGAHRHHHRIKGRGGNQCVTT